MTIIVIASEAKQSESTYRGSVFVWIAAVFRPRNDVKIKFSAHANQEPREHKAK